MYDKTTDFEDQQTRTTSRPQTNKYYRTTEEHNLGLTNDVTTDLGGNTEEIQICGKY